MRMSLRRLTGLLALALVVLAGCGGVSSLMKTGLITTSWHGKAPAALIAKWGKPSLDVTGSAMIANQQYWPMSSTSVRTGPVTVTKTDHDKQVVRLIVYTFDTPRDIVSADGKTRVHLEAAGSESFISFGVYKSGNIETSHSIFTGKLPRATSPGATPASGKP